MNTEELQLVERLRAAPQAACTPDFNANVFARIHAQQDARRFAWRAALAASFALALAFAAIFGRRNFTPSAQPSSIAQEYITAYRLAAANVSSQSFSQALDHILKTQKADGSWANDHLTARNLAALELASAHGRPELLPCVRRARRYLRLSGLQPLSASQFSAELQKHS